MHPHLIPVQVAERPLDDGGGHRGQVAGIAFFSQDVSHIGLERAIDSVEHNPYMRSGRIEVSRYVRDQVCVETRITTRVAGDAVHGIDGHRQVHKAKARLGPAAHVIVPVGEYYVISVILTAFSGKRGSVKYGLMTDVALAQKFCQSEATVIDIAFRFPANALNASIDYIARISGLAAHHPLEDIRIMQLVITA